MSPAASLAARSLRARGSKYPRCAVLALKQIFDEYDRDGSGYVDLQEFSAVLQRQKDAAQRTDGSKKSLTERRATQVGTPFLLDFAVSMFRTLDLNADDQVDFEELLRVLYPLATAQEIRTMLAWATRDGDAKARAEEEARQAEERRLEELDLHAIFAAYDRDGNGQICRAEFRQGMISGGWSERELAELFEGADKDGSGYLDYDEFKQLMRRDAV